MTTPNQNTSSLTPRTDGILDLLIDHARILEQELELAKRAAGFCEKHKPDGGARNCLVCGCIELSYALHQIDYIFSVKNEMEVSDYDLHGDPDVVVKRTKQKIAELAAREAQHYKEERVLLLEFAQAVADGCVRSKERARQILKQHGSQYEPQILRSSQT